MTGETKCIHGRWTTEDCGQCAEMLGGKSQGGPPTKNFLTDIDVLVRERDQLRRELSQFDCRRTGGPVSDVSGVHCPPGAPCMRCRLEVAEARLARVDAAAAEMVDRVKHLAWVASGAPMLGEEPLK